VKANIISPGAILTEKWENCVGRMGRPDEIAAAVTFVASVASEMAGYMTASNIQIDGGEAISFH
jgi:NAD(P)-dependent dehydrogenase (short-subunit alcohol dehydrogenase family)